MSEFAKNIVDAAINQDPVAAKKAFDDAVSQKIMDRLSDMYPDVAARQYSAEEPQEDSAEDEVTNTPEEE